MTARGWVLLALLVKCVLSVPVSTDQMENEDVQVMKCIVEVLADVLSKPHTIPVSQQCLQTLRTDDRLVTILRHRNFLQELQDIALEGANERPEKRMKDSADYVSNHPEGAERTAADRSMLVAMERPGEEKEEKRGEEEESDRGSEEGEQRMQERNEISSQEKRNEEEKEEDTMKEEQEHKRGGMKKKVDNEDEEEKRSQSEEQEEEADEAAGAGDHSDVKKSVEEEESQEEQDTVEKHRDSPGELEEKKEKVKSGLKHWSHTRQLAQRKSEKGAYVQQEAEHHSKEVLGQAEGEVWKSPEEQELQMMARRDSEDRREEEGSASKKTEDTEIESLAAIESELENVAQKLHELRHG